MGSHCPMCGGKWDFQGEHYEVDLRCGDEHDIICLYCKRTIKFVMERQELELRYQINFESWNKMLEEAEEKIKNLTDRLTYKFQASKEWDVDED